MKSAINSPNYCLPDSPIHSAISILTKKTSIRGGLTVQSERKKRRLAYRLFSCLRIAQREIVQCENTHGNFRLGPLSRGVGNRFIIIHIPLNNFSNDSECRIYYLPQSQSIAHRRGIIVREFVHLIEIFQLDTVSLRNGVHRVS